MLTNIKICDMLCDIICIIGNIAELRVDCLFLFGNVDCFVEFYLVGNVENSLLMLSAIEKLFKRHLLYESII